METSFYTCQETVDLKKNLLQNMKSSGAQKYWVHILIQGWKKTRKSPHRYLCLYPNAKHTINISNYIVCATALLRVLVSLGWPWFNQDKITYGHLLCSFSSSFLASHSFRLVLSCLNYPLHALFCLFPWKLQETKKQA